jgi:hypothetical protein
MSKLNTLKWSATIVLISGVFMTSAGIYPIGVFVSLAGSVLWTLSAYLMKDITLLVNNSVILIITIMGLMLGANING